MNETQATLALQASIDSLTGVVVRHGPKSDGRITLGVATYLGDGCWAVMADAAYAGNVYGQFTGTHELIDLWIHPVTGGEFPVQWGHKSLLKPLAILHAPGSGNSAPSMALSSELAFPEYRKVWRNTFGGAAVFADIGFDTSIKTVAIEGCIFSVPRLYRWSPERDDLTPAVQAGFEYPGHKDAGGPVVDENGRLAGMLLGPDFGPGEAHKGLYIPIDYILPSLALSQAGVTDSRTRMRGVVDFVGHRSTDVSFSR